MTKSVLGHLSEAAILNMKIKDLPIDENKIPFPEALKKLRLRLKSRGINWTPHIWPSEEWFSPDGITGFAFPFTLLDSKLSRLEKKYVGFIEGDKEKEFFKLACHETGHAIDNAFHLRRNRKRQNLFGKSSLPYPSSYIPKPHSKCFVKHLPDNYAQAHPEEDWAETFAVWLGDKNAWKRKYFNSSALQKLLLVDEMMKAIRFKSPRVLKNSTPLHFKDDERTLKEYFDWRRESLGLNRRNFFNKKVDTIFKSSQGECAYVFIKENEHELCQRITNKTGVTKHIAKNITKELGNECKNRDFRLKYSKRRSQKLVMDVLTKHTQEFLDKKRHRIFM